MVRLDSPGYTDKVLKECFYQNRNSDRFYELRYTAYYKVKTYPLLQLLHLANDPEQQRLQNQPHSPAIRQSITIEKHLTEEYCFLKANGLHTEENIPDFIDSCTDKIAALEQQRQKIRNSNRRPNSPEERAEKNHAAREIFKKLKPLWKELKLAQDALEHYPRVWELLQAEHETETEKEVDSINNKNAPINIPIEKLHPFEEHPFKVLDNEEMNQLTQSIQELGILSPLIVRPKENTTDEYKIVSGHRRFRAADKAGIREVPAFVVPMDWDAATIALVDSNLHREHILPSEKAFAYKLKMEAMSHQGTSC